MPKQRVKKIRRLEPKKPTVMAKLSQQDVQPYAAD